MPAATILLQRHGRGGLTFLLGGKRTSLGILGGGATYQAQRRRMMPLSGPRFGWFVIEEKAGAEFLNALTGIIRGGERAIPPTLQTTGPISRSGSVFRIARASP